MIHVNINYVYTILEPKKNGLKSGCHSDGVCVKCTNYKSWQKLLMISGCEHGVTIGGSGLILLRVFPVFFARIFTHSIHVYYILGTCDGSKG